ncbi:hypothetical protein [Dawidia soli]|uniref:Uncharacterized protein n=1 Tax=Dawidia soli TaxID=2782352 RepID=A0AAP2GF11_9BACT|nr:hypothetical protein [Dawidia soli]MBT1689002.1 hypothetical protein [Dawidia soli]
MTVVLPKYHLSRLGDQNDVLDSVKTKFVEGSNIMILPYYSIAKVEGLALFGVPGMFWEMKNALQSAKLTGVKFEKIANISRDFK